MPRVTLLSRRLKVAPVASPTVPLDLVRPRDLATPTSRGSLIESPPSQKHKQSNGASQNNQCSTDPHGDIPVKPEPLTDRQGPVIGPNPQLSQASTQNREKARAHAPVVIRPKKKASIFMPKKPNKVRSFPWRLLAI